MAGLFPHLRSAGLSDVGRKRTNNEDSFGVYPEAGVFCVADGMGGGDDGEVASAATVKEIEKFVLSHYPPAGVSYASSDYVDGLCNAVNIASTWIYARAMGKRLKGCGSTFVGISFDPANPDEATAMHAGDSRLYRIRGRSIQQITKDHSAAELIGAKDDGDINPMFRGMILRAVGIHPDVDIERTPVQVKQGDKFIICSDGLSRMVPDKKILAIAREASSPESAVKALIAAANEAGGIDNVTAIMVDVGQLPTPIPAVAMPVEKKQTTTKDTSTASTQTTVEDTASGNGDGWQVTLDTRNETAESFDAQGTSESGTLSPIGDTVTGVSVSSGVPKTVTIVPPVIHEEPGSKPKMVILLAVLVAILGGGLYLGVKLYVAQRARAAEEARIAEEQRVAREAEEKLIKEQQAQILAEKEKLRQARLDTAKQLRDAEESAQREAEEKAKKLAELEKMAAEMEAKAKAAAEAKEKAAAEEAERQRKLDEEAKLKAEAEAKAKAEAEAKAAAEEEARRKVEEAEAQRKAEEEKRKAEEAERKRIEEENAKKESERQRLAEEARRQAEAKAKEEADRKAEEARLKAEEEARRKAAEDAERQRKLEEEARLKAEAEAKAKAEAEAKAAAEGAERQRKLDEEAKQKAEAEAKAKAEAEARAAAEEARRKAEEACLKAEEEARRKAAEEAEAKAKAAAEAKAKAEEAKALAAQSEAQNVTEAFVALVEVCDKGPATNFVRKVLGMSIKIPGNFYGRLAILRDNNKSESERMPEAHAVVKDVQQIASKILDYSVTYEEFQKDVANDVSASAKSREEAKRKLAAMPEFKELVQKLMAGNPEDPGTMMSCAKFLRNVPIWF